MELKAVLTETFIYKLLYVNAGIVGVVCILALLQKVLWHQNNIIEIICNILLGIGNILMFITFFAFLLFCHVNHDKRLFSAVIIFVIYLPHVIRTLIKIKKEGWRGLL